MTDAPVLLSSARPTDLLAELGRRFGAFLSLLPDGKRLTRADYVLGIVVLALALTSTGFFTAAYRIWLDDPTYFSRRLIASMENANVDPIETGSVSAAPAEAAGETADVLPARPIQRATPLKPADFEIVMVHGDEAWLATARELFRAKVGSVLPGLGRVLSIDAIAGSLTAENATLRSAPR